MGSLDMANDQATRQPPDYRSSLDEGVYDAVVLLNENGIKTEYSCDGSLGHLSLEPVIHLDEDEAGAFRAVAILKDAGIRVVELRFVYSIWIIHMEDALESSKKPRWEITLNRTAAARNADLALAAFLASIAALRNPSILEHLEFPKYLESCQRDFWRYSHVSNAGTKTKPGELAMKATEKE